MNKKFLSAILFGALMVTATGTFVSCKDYDDDIKDLQEKVDKLATKEDMTSQIATLQTALTAAAKDASDAITKAAAAETAAKAASDAAAEAKAAADKAVAEAKAESIKAVQAELEALKKEVTEATESALADMRKEVAEATKKVEDIVGKIADMVTSVELVDSYTADNGQYDETKAVLNFASAVVEKDFTFLKFNDKAVEGAIEFKKGEQKQTPDEFIVRVSPTNAVLTTDMISLVNSKGENLNEFLDVVSVDKFDGLLTRAVSETGLWKVKVQLKKYEKDSFQSATLADPSKSAAAGNYILFAVQVNNTLTTASTRFVTSSFDLTIAKENYTPAGELKFYVDETPVTNINNRVIGKTGKSLTDNDKITYAELEWKNATAKAEVKDADINKGTSGAPVDDRSEKNVLLAIQGANIKIDLAKDITGAYKDMKTPSEIRAMYVVLDKANAVQSLNSEINAWNSYTYSGLDKVVEGTSTTISVNADFTINDIIGFRVYAVNQDGKLVDPDGRAFYVQIGTAGEDWNAVATKVMAGIASPKDVHSDKVPVSLTKLNGAATFTWATDKCEAKHENVFNIQIMKGNAEIFNTTGTYTEAELGAINFKEATSVIATPAANCTWLDYKDDKAYNGTLTIKNKTGFVLATLKVSMTKVLPTSMPEGYSLKDKQVIGGIYNCYMLASDGSLADSWTAESATQGRMPIENLINWGKDTSNGAQYVVVFEKSADDGVETGVKDKALDDVVRAGNGIVNVDKKYVDNTTEHATAVYYNYGKVSTETKDANGAIDDYMIAGDSFKTVYCCFYKKEVHTWDWATRAQLGGDYNTLVDPKDASQGYKANPLSTTLTYGTPATGSTGAYNAMVFGKNAIDGTFSKLLSAAYSGSLVVKNAKLISDATQKEDYFSVDTELKFTALKTDLGSNPKENVPSTLIVNCKDSYGHDVVITLKMTVQPRK